MARKKVSEAVESKAEKVDSGRITLSFRVSGELLERIETVLYKRMLRSIRQRRTRTNASASTLIREALEHYLPILEAAEEKLAASGKAAK